MKGFRATWVMAAGVIALAGYTYYEYKNASEDLDRAQGERAAFTLKREDIDGFQITSGGQSAEFRKTGDQWHQTKPIEDLAETSAVEGFLFQALSPKLKMFRSAEEAKDTNWSQYGLENPRATIEFSAKGKKEAFSISAKNAFDGSFYVRQKDELLLGDPGLAQIAERQASSLRSRRLWREEEAKVNLVSVDVDGGKEKFALRLDGEKWVMEPQPPFEIDGARVDSWIESVQDIMPSDFVKEGIDEKDKAEYLLKKPALVVTFAFKGKDGKDGQWTMTVGQDKAGEHFIYTSVRPTIYKAGAASLKKLSVSKAYFRNGHLPFALPTEQAREVRVRTEKISKTFKKSDTGWALAETDKEMELDQEKLVQLFQNIRSLEAQEFVDKATGFKGQPQIEILGADGKVLFALSWGDEYKAKSPWNTGSSLRYVRSDLNGKWTTGVAKDKLDKLVDPGLLRKKVLPAPAKPAQNMSSQPEKK